MRKNARQHAWLRNSDWDTNVSPPNTQLRTERNSKVLLIAFVRQLWCGAPQVCLSVCHFGTNSAFCINVMTRLREATRCTRPQKCRNEQVVHSDNALCRPPSVTVRQSLEKTQNPTIPHPRHSPATSRSYRNSRFGSKVLVSRPYNKLNTRNSWSQNFLRAEGPFFRACDLLTFLHNLCDTHILAMPLTAVTSPRNDPGSNLGTETGESDKGFRGLCQCLQETINIIHCIRPQATHHLAK
jgi:hypothetical protein